MKKLVFIFLLLFVFIGCNYSQWVLHPSLPFQRAQHALVAHPNGNIYLFNGYIGADPPSNNLFFYNVSNNTWYSGANAPFSTRGLAYCLGTDNHIYAVGGTSNNSLARYNPSTNTWTLLANCPNGAWEGSMACYNNKLYYVGGSLNLTSLRIYDINTNTWSTGAAIPNGIMQHKTISDNQGNIYVFGGKSTLTVDVTVVQKYNIAANTWSVVNSMPTPRNQYGACLGPDGQIYLVGGKTSYLNNALPFFNDVFIYNPCTESWSTGTPHPIPVGELAVASTSNGIFAMGGTNGSVLINNYFLPVSPVSLAYPNLTLSPSNGQLCINNQSTISVSGANTYTWSNNSTFDTLIINPSVNFTIQVAGTNTLGCTSSITKSFTVNSLPNVSIIGNFTTCANETVTLTGSGAQTYTWSGNYISTIFTLSPVTSTLINLTGSDSNSCSATTNQTISVYPLPTLNITSSHSLICAGSTATLSASGALSYTWSNGSINNSITVNPLTTTNFSLIGIDSNNCKNTTNYIQNVTNCTAEKELFNPYDSFNVYPNPNKGFIYISSNKEMKVKIFDSYGILKGNFVLTQGNNFTIKINSLETGFYFITNENNQFLKKIVCSKDL